MAELEEWSNCFWSYVRSDNKLLFGKLDAIREDLINLYKIETGNELKIFSDTDSIGWGEQWESSLELGIEKTIFMTPIVTPNYFQSQACRQELMSFYSKCESLELTDLILPIIISGKDKISIESDDPVIRIIAQSQYEDFSNVWKCDRGSETWVSAILRAVTKLRESQNRVESRLEASIDRVSRLRTEVDLNTDAGTLPPELSTEDEDTPGILEILEDLTPRIEDATVHLEDATSKLRSLSSLIEDESGRTQISSSNQKLRRTYLIKMADSISTPAKEFEKSASLALTKINDVDTKIKDLFGVMQGHEASDLMQNFRTNLEQSMGNTDGMEEIRDQLHTLSVEISAAENISSVMQRALRPARRGVIMLRDALLIYLHWHERVRSLDFH